MNCSFGLKFITFLAQFLLIYLKFRLIPVWWKACKSPKSKNALISSVGVIKKIHDLNLESTIEWHWSDLPLLAWTWRYCLKALDVTLLHPCGDTSVLWDTAPSHPFGWWIFKLCMFISPFIFFTSAITFCKTLLTAHEHRPRFQVQKRKTTDLYPTLWRCFTYFILTIQDFNSNKYNFCPCFTVRSLISNTEEIEW